MKKAFTLIEMIITIVILGILSTGSFIALQQLYLRAAKSKAISELSFDSALITQQLSTLLSHRVPTSVIGYDSTNNRFESIYNTTDSYHILEWIGTAYESFQAKTYSGFIDLHGSNRETLTLFSPDTNMSLLAPIIQEKFNAGSLDIFATEMITLLFAGTYDDGGIEYAQEFNSSFGWHGNPSNKIYTISNSTQESNITLDSKPDAIYEKYFLADTAYAVARGENVNLSADCIQTLNQPTNDNTLFLFLNYRPWKNETFCADPNGANQEGNVTILSNEAAGFEVDFVDANLVFKLTLKRNIPKNSQKNSVTISKQKVIF